MNYEVYSLYSSEHLVDSIDCVDKGDVRFDSKCKMKISSHPEPIKGKTRVECGDKTLGTSDHLLVSLSNVSSEVARVQANLEVDLVLQELKLYIVLIVWLLTRVFHGLDSAKLKLGVDNYLLKEGSRTKLVMSLNLIALVERNYKLQQMLVAIFNLFYILNNLCFSTSGAKGFQFIIEMRWEKLRREPPNLEQAWLIPEPCRNTWGESREF